MSNDILFDNFIITDSKRVADQWAADGWRLKYSEESAAAVSVFVQFCVRSEKVDHLLSAEGNESTGFRIRVPMPAFNSKLALKWP